MSRGVMIKEYLGGGVVLYKNVLDLDFDRLRSFALEQAEAEMAEMYTPGKDPRTGEEGYLNRNGYFFDAKGIECMPRHCAFVYSDPDPDIKEILETIETTTDQCVADYIDQFSIAAMSVWWKIRGHILVYPPDSFLGIHADTSTDYAYGSPHPPNQIATRTVVSTIAFFNDSVDDTSQLDGTNFMGGWLAFKYLGIRYKPRKGDLIVFPSNYMGAHACEMVKGGTRFSHVGWYCQGTPNPEVGENVIDPTEATEEMLGRSTNVYLTKPLGRAMRDVWAGQQPERWGYGED